MSHKKAVSALRLASSPVRITIYREDPESIFTSYEGNECFLSNLKFLDLIAGNTYHPHIIIPFCLLVIFLLIVTFIFEDILDNTVMFLASHDLYLTLSPCILSMQNPQQYLK